MYLICLKAENVAKKYSISREEQDLFALSSQQKCEAAQNSGYFDEEIVPVSIATRQGTSESILILLHACMIQIFFFSFVCIFCINYFSWKLAETFGAKLPKIAYCNTAKQF